MRKFIIAPVAAIIFALSACAGVTEGTVYAKDYVPAKSWETTEPTYQQVCETRMRARTVNGNTQMESYQDCRQKQVGWHQEHHHKPECYKIKFRNSEGDEGDDCVSPKEYEDISEGDFYRED